MLSDCIKISKMIMKKLSVTKDTKFRGRISGLSAAFPLTHATGIIIINMSMMLLNRAQSKWFL